ncbi:sigma-70 family RNA polymerase sigma factor [Epidermidibacterium keratini]|uniref:Sigma-70 family RNA polymerase sigma factor n=1 Tax=Epidermidibacterium keratini TaxID=1891644 RepID=A0A7L4YK21_9ACTN|nr:RNA polymerase sigma factor SigJ [Epidermidibacterium keratini]QHB99431.1 sigma-70 family RNA polymerase sigma factor [Epidermidibacterium keratini]
MTDTRDDAVYAEGPQLRGLAYRLLGSMADAEDVVQTAYTRWFALAVAERERVANPGAWLSTVVSRLCIDLQRSARARREVYVGEWLPEPLPGNGSVAGRPAELDPSERVTLDESISMAFLVMLESMTAAERVSFILHDVYRYPFADIAEIVGRSPEACRQLASAARRHVREADAPVSSTVADQAEVLDALMRSWERQDIEGLVGVLDPNVRFVADGGGQVSAVLDPIDGADLVARQLAEIRSRAGDLQLEPHEVNGRPGLVARIGGKVVTVFGFEFAGRRVCRIFAVRNPDKLDRWRGASRS